VYLKAPKNPNNFSKRVADVGPRQRVVAADEAGVFNAMQQHVGDAEHVRQLLLFDPMERLLHGLFIGHPLDVALAHVTDGAGEESAGATGGVKQALARPGSMRSTMKAVTARGV